MILMQNSLRIKIKKNGEQRNSIHIQKYSLFLCLFFFFSSCKCAHTNKRIFIHSTCSNTFQHTPKQRITNRKHQHTNLKPISTRRSRILTLCTVVFSKQCGSKIRSVLCCVNLFHIFFFFFFFFCFFFPLLPSFLMFRIKKKTVAN